MKCHGEDCSVDSCRNVDDLIEYNASDEEIEERRLKATDNDDADNEMSEADIFTKNVDSKTFEKHARTMVSD